MAIKIHDYFNRHKRRALLGLAFVQLITAAIIGVALWLLLNQSVAGALNLAITVALLTAAISLLLTPLILSIANRPARILSQAIAHVSKDPVVTPPPKLKKGDTRSGLSDLVQTIYELSVASVSKISDRIQNQGSQQSEFFKNLANLIPSGIIALDANGRVVFANQAAPTSPTPQGQMGINLIFEQNNTLGDWLRQARVNKVRDTKLWLRIGDKLPSQADRRIFDVIGSYQKNDASGIETILVTFDRTSVYANDQEDMDFIALAAHELRGPITVIRGYLDVIAEEVGPKLDGEQIQLLERLQVASERLAGYVSNILNVSRYDRHQFAVHPQEDSLVNIIKSIGPDLALRAKTQNRSIALSIPNNLPTVAVDPSGIGEVITNLVDNAIKYSHDGGQVVITATHKENWIEITVQDQGIGIPANIVGHLFSRFYRSYRSKQQVGGTGLGLYICKTIIEAHGGTIWVRSVEGRGSTFGFTIPTYASVADKLKNGNNNSQGIVRRAEGWIKNHAMYRG